MSLTNHLQLGRTERQAHANLSTPCVPSSQAKAREALLKHLGLTDDVPAVFRQQVHVSHLCECGSRAENPCSNPLHLYFGLARENRSDTGKRPEHRGKRPPAYDGSRGALPTEPQDVKQLVQRYGRSRSTVFGRRDLLVKHGLVSPERRWRSVLYSPEDVLQFDKLDYWFSLGFTNEEVDAHLSQPPQVEVVAVAEGEGVAQGLLELFREFTFKAEQLLTAHGVK